MTKPSGMLVAVIGVLKLTKAALLLTLGVGGLLSTPWRLGHAVESSVVWTGVFSGRDSVHRALAKVWSLDSAGLQRLAALSLCYATVFAIEGVGLLRRKRWAEWMTVLVTTSFIPFELYELVHGFGGGKVVALILNVAIVLYLVWRRLHERATSFCDERPCPSKNFW